MRLSGRGLKCVRGGRDIFAGLDVEVAAGHALAVTGINGAGKSSLLRMIAGLLPLAGGTLRLEGGEDDLTLPEQAHYLGHRDAMKPALTVRENLEFWRNFLGGPLKSPHPEEARSAVSKDRGAFPENLTLRDAVSDETAPQDEVFKRSIADDVAASLDRVGLGHAAQLPAAFLSAGQRRRLSIARLLTVRRPVWLLDEPTSALDTSGQELIAGLMADHLRGGGIILAATHGPLGISANELRIGGAA